MQTDQAAQPSVARAAEVRAVSWPQVRPPGWGVVHGGELAGGEHVEVGMQPPGRRQASQRCPISVRGELSRADQRAQPAVQACHARSGQLGAVAWADDGIEAGQHRVQPRAKAGAEQGLDDQMRQVMDDVYGAAPGDASGGQPGTVPVARTGGLDQGYLHHRRAHPGMTRMP